MESVLLDVAGHRRSPGTMPGYHRGRPPRNKGQQYPADPPTVEEIVAVMRTVDDRADGHRLRALIVLLWRAGLRIRLLCQLGRAIVWRVSDGGLAVKRFALCRCGQPAVTAAARRRWYGSEVRWICDPPAVVSGWRRGAVAGRCGAWGHIRRGLARCAR